MGCTFMVFGVGTYPPEGYTGQIRSGEKSILPVYCSGLRITSLAEHSFILITRLIIRCLKYARRISHPGKQSHYGAEKTPAMKNIAIYLPSQTSLSTFAKRVI
jgi:hypothetical protein